MIGSMPSRHGTRRLGPYYRFAALVLKPPMTVLTRRDWHGAEYLRQDYPPTDGIVVVSNHLSWFDPIPLAHILWLRETHPRIYDEAAALLEPVDWLNLRLTGLACASADIASIQHDTLIIHGREDQVIPTETSQMLFRLIPNAQLHMFGKCGHWTQIEQNARFCAVVESFLAGVF